MPKKSTNTANHTTIKKSKAVAMVTKQGARANVETSSLFDSCGYRCAVSKWTEGSKNAYVHRERHYNTSGVKNRKITK